MERCKHNNGWCVKKSIFVFVNQHSILCFDFKQPTARGQKLKVRCNNPDCDKVRNIYVRGRVIKWGRVRKAKVQ